MSKQELEKAIEEVVTEFQFTTEQIQNELIIYLQEKYYMPPPEEMLKDAIIQEAKELVVTRLYNSINCEIGEGWNNYSVIPSFKFLLRMILAPAHRLFFDEILNELITDELIYLKTVPGDKEPKNVGLTEKGILFKAEMDVFGANICP